VSRRPAPPTTDLDDAELEAQGAQAHATRNWVFLHGTAEQLAHHTERMLALEQEYVRRHPRRTWQGVEQGPGSTPPADPVRAVLQAVAAAGGRLHKLEVHQAARAAGLPRAALAELYGQGLLTTDGPDRVLTGAGRVRCDSAPPTAPEPGALRWVAVADPTWDGDVVRVVGGAAPGVFDLQHAPGTALAGDWWSAQDTDGTVLGFGWMDVGWGEAEVLLAVAPGARSAGVGTFVLARLEVEAARRGLNYVYNTVRPTHPDHDAVHDWLLARGYAGSSSDAALRKRVGLAPEPPTEVPGPSSSSAAAGPAGGSDRGPGHEDQGGYVDVEDHAY
jgi:GNAT superfamily N-acetyltransferase